MADSHYVVAIGVPHERGEVTVMVLRPQPGLMKTLGPDGHRGGEEGEHGLTIGRCKRDVTLSEAVAGAFRADPKRPRLARDTEADGSSRLFAHSPPAKGASTAS
jgi:hypothetical protein